MIRWDEEKLGCTFHPEINEHSKVLVEERERQLQQAEAAGVLDQVASEKAARRHRVGEQQAAGSTDHRDPRQAGQRQGAAAAAAQPDSLTDGMYVCGLQHHAGCVSEEAFPYRPDIGVNHYSDRVETPQQFVERLAVHDPLKRQDKIHAISKVGRTTTRAAARAGQAGRQAGSGS